MRIKYPAPTAQKWKWAANLQIEQLNPQNENLIFLGFIYFLFLGFFGPLEPGGGGVEQWALS